MLSVRFLSSASPPPSILLAVVVRFLLHPGDLSFDKPLEAVIVMACCLPVARSAET
jgi:hypothetical protein